MNRITQCYVTHMLKLNMKEFLVDVKWLYNKGTFKLLVINLIRNSINNALIIKQ